MAVLLDETHSQTVAVPNPTSGQAAEAARRPRRAPHDAEASAAARALYDAYRRQIEHEDNLVSQRAAWLLMAQSFFVVGYCILHQLAPPAPRDQPVNALLTQLIAPLGLLSAALILVGVLAAGRVMCDLRARLAAHRAADPMLDQLLNDYPPLQPLGRPLLLGRSPAVLLPALFIIFWTLMIAARAAAL